MATTLAPVENREVVRCDQCHLVQFKTVNNLCRRCRTSLDEDEPEPILTPLLPVMEPETFEPLRGAGGAGHPQSAAAYWAEPAATGAAHGRAAHLRLEDREREGHADAVVTGTAGGGAGGQRPRPAVACGPSRADEINELLADPFIAEMAAFTSQLDAMQRTSVLAQIRDMVAHPRRYPQN